MSLTNPAIMNAVSDAPKGKGGSAETHAAPVQDLTMLSVVERPDAGKSKQEVLDFLYEGFCKISAVEMNRVLLACQYENQRQISERHVSVLADLMARGQWLPKSQIDFAVLGGQLILINGYHRAYAQVKSGKSIEWSVVFHPVKTQADLRSLYFGFDTNVRIRNSREILRASEFAAIHGLPAEIADSLYRAVPYIAAGFRMTDRDFLADKQVDRRLSIATEYAKAAANYAACIDGVAQRRKMKFKGASVTAVAVVTFRYQNVKAWEFWSGVATNDGLKRGDPRNALVMDFLTRKIVSGNSIDALAPAMIAWNAFFNDREAFQIRVGDKFVPTIDGTPFNGRKG